MNNRYFRKKDEAIMGDLDSQSQRPSYSQYQASQFHMNNSYGSAGNRYSFGNGNSNNCIGGGLGGNTQFDASQNGSYNNSNQDSITHPHMKQEIDLLELCKDINQETFKNENDKKVARGNENIQKRKMQGTGQFHITKTDKNSEALKVNRSYQASTQVVDIDNALKPKVNQKNNSSLLSEATVKGGSAIAGFMGIKQEETKQLKPQQAAQIKVEPLVRAKEQENIQHSTAPKPLPCSQQQPNQRAKPNKKVNKKMIQIAEFASNLNADDFFNHDSSKNQQDEQMMVDDEFLEESSREQEKQQKKKKVATTNNRKRKKNEISSEENNMQLCDEIDEQDEDYQQESKRRRLNNVFDKPAVIQKGISSRFMINKKNFEQKSEKPAVLDRQRKPDILFSEQQNIFGVKQESISQNRRDKCQHAFNEYFNTNLNEPEEYIIFKMLSKIRKHGVNWMIGEMADFKMKDAKISDQLRKNTKKLRVMMPVQNFNTKNNSNRQREQSNDRNSNSSTATNTYAIGGLMVVEAPVILSSMLQQQQQEEFYLSLLGKQVCKYESSILATNKAKVAINLSQSSNQTV